MSYKKYLQEQAEIFGVPKTIWRDMDNIMMTIATLSHTLSKETMYEILTTKYGWRRENLDFVYERHILVSTFQNSVFSGMCEDSGITEKNFLGYLDYWNNL